MREHATKAAQKCDKANARPFATWLTKISVLNLECPPKHPKLPSARSASSFKMLATSLSDSGKLPGHHVYARRNVETVQPIEVKYP